MCVQARACGCAYLSFCVSVSTGELKYGDVCDPFMHVKKAFSSFCRVRGGQHLFPLLSLLRRQLFSSHPLAVYANRVLHARKKLLKE